MPAVIERLHAAGFELTLTVERQLRVAPASRLTPEQRALVLAHKPELVQFLLDAHATTTKLIDAAMRACDHFGDGRAARNEMRRQCLDTPIHVRADLIDHFNHTYPQNHKPEGK